jgi:hypothetical protein
LCLLLFSLAKGGVLSVNVNPQSYNMIICPFKRKYYNPS